MIFPEIQITINEKIDKSVKSQILRDTEQRMLTIEEVLRHSDRAWIAVNDDKTRLGVNAGEWQLLDATVDIPDTRNMGRSPKVFLKMVLAILGNHYLGPWYRAMAYIARLIDVSRCPRQCMTQNFDDEPLCKMRSNLLVRTDENVIRRSLPAGLKCFRCR